MPETAEMLLPITLTVAAAATLLNMWLALRVARVRVSHKIMTGDGGDATLVARMRAQANFVEYTPFILILFGLVEYARGPRTWLWAVGIAYILARIAHPFGMERPAPNPLRMGSITVTFAALLALSVYAIILSYSALAPHA